MSDSSVHSHDSPHKEQISQTNDISHISNTNTSSQFPSFSANNAADNLINQIQQKSLKYWGKYALDTLEQHSLNKKQSKNNLALVLAQRMPKHIRSQVIKMINYYQDHMSDQLQHIHSLVSENSKLKKKVSQLENAEQINNKQNVKCENEIQIVSSLVGSNKSLQQQNQRIEELQTGLIDKNKQIANLNKEITTLYGQVKKYKKRLYEVESKSPAKMERKSPASTIRL